MHWGPPGSPVSRSQTHRFEAPDVPEALDRPKHAANDVDHSGEGVFVKCLHGCDEASVRPIIDDGKWRGDGCPDAEGRVDSEGKEKPGIRQRPVIPRGIVDTLVPAVRAQS